MSVRDVESSPDLAVDAILADVGSQVRDMRKTKGLTLSELSKATGLSTAIISQIERGLANPSFTTLAQLAHGLEIPVEKLFPSHVEARSTVVRKRSEERR